MKLISCRRRVDMHEDRAVTSVMLSAYEVMVTYETPYEGHDVNQRLRDTIEALRPQTVSDLYRIGLSVPGVANMLVVSVVGAKAPPGALSLCEPGERGGLSICTRTEP